MANPIIGSPDAFTKHNQSQPGYGQSQPGYGQPQPGYGQPQGFDPYQQQASPATAAASQT